MVPNGPKLCQVVPNGPKWSQMVSLDLKWSQMVPNWLNEHLEKACKAGFFLVSHKL